MLEQRVEALGERRTAFSHTEEKDILCNQQKELKYCCVCVFYVCVLYAGGILMQTDCQSVDLRGAEHENH